MSKLSWGLMTGAAAAAAVVTGCATAPGPMGTATGRAAVATVSPCAGPETQVTINQVSITGPTSASISVNPGRANIGRNAAGVRWKFSQGNNYAFTSDGVVFKPSAPPGPARAVPSSDLSEYRWCFNATSGNLEWPYTIKFYAPATPAVVWSCDPAIANFDGGGLTTTSSVTVQCTAGS